MASFSIHFQLANSKGLDKIICINGLGYDLVIHPTIHGEPLLTSQAFYYLKSLDSVARLNIDISLPRLKPNQVEYLIDNYLFEYSASNPNSKITTKVDEYVFWKDDIHNLYHRYDQTNTGALVADEANDSSIIEIKPIDDNTSLHDWCIPKNYTAPIVGDYVSKMHALLAKKVMLFMYPNEYRDGYMGKKRIFDCGEGLLDLYQAERLDNIRSIKKDDNEFTINSSFDSAYDISIPIERVECNKLYNPLLLSYYFSGLNAKNTLSAFLGFYNVLEYYFEEAPVITAIKAKYEREQLKSVVTLLTNHSGIDALLKSQQAQIYTDLVNAINTSSAISIDGLNALSGDLLTELSRWLYEIRCAIVHSKKTRLGKTTPIFEPYSEPELG